jgi:hypothetical protein
MATYLHAREADAYARLLERRRRSKAAPSFRFEPRAMPTIVEKPVGLPPPGLRYTLYAPRRAEAAVDECAARAAAAAAEDAATRRYLAKRATAPRAPAPVPADARTDLEARKLHQLMETVDEEHAALARQTFRETVPGSPPRRQTPFPVGAGPMIPPPPVARQPGAAPPETAREGRPAGTKCVADECGVLLFYVLCCPVAMLLHKRHHG